MYLNWGKRLAKNGKGKIIRVRYTQFYLSISIIQGIMIDHYINFDYLGRLPQKYLGEMGG